MEKMSSCTAEVPFHYVMAPVQVTCQHQSQLQKANPTEPSNLSENFISSLGLPFRLSQSSPFARRFNIARYTCRLITPRPPSTSVFRFLVGVAVVRKSAFRRSRLPSYHGQSSPLTSTSPGILLSSTRMTTRHWIQPLALNLATLVGFAPFQTVSWIQCQTCAGAPG